MSWFFRLAIQASVKLDHAYQNVYSGILVREREFNPDHALERAVAVFTDRGYFDTSMDELVNAMGVARYGVYNTWGNKRELFIAALDKFAELNEKKYHAMLRLEDASLPEIREFFGAMKNMPAEARFGCMVCNTATEVAPHDEEIALACRQVLERLTVSLKKALLNAVRRKELKARHDIDDLAEYLTGILRNASVMTRAGYSSEEIGKQIDIAVSVLD